MVNAVSVHLKIIAFRLKDRDKTVLVTLLTFKTSPQTSSCLYCAMVDRARDSSASAEYFKWQHSSAVSGL